MMTIDLRALPGLVCPEGDGRDDFHGVRFVSAAAMAVAAMQGERGGTRDVLI